MGFKLSILISLFKWQTDHSKVHLVLLMQVKVKVKVGVLVPRTGIAEVDRDTNTNFVT